MSAIYTAEDIDDLSEMLTQTFRAWADKHGCAKFVETVVDCEEYDLTTGRPVWEENDGNTHTG